MYNRITEKRQEIVYAVTLSLMLRGLKSWAYLFFDILERGSLERVLFKEGSEMRCFTLKHVKLETRYIAMESISYP